MMLDARSPEFWRLYQNYCDVYDARGQKIHCVIACNPETGEVIRCDTTDNGSLVMNTGPFRSLWRSSSREFAYFFLGIPWLKISRLDLYDGGLRRRHGFWPAPLRVVPVPCRVGDGVRGQRVDITAAEIIARARAKEQPVDIPNGGAGIAYLDELIDNAEGGE